MRTTTPLTVSPRSEFWAGFRATIPLVIGAIPFGFIFGATAVANKISPAGTMAMSLFVFAGASQFIAAGLISGGAGVLVIILTTFFVNLRHALYSATLAPHMKHLSQRWLVPLGFWLTDETFVVVATRYNQSDPSPYKHWYHLGSALFMYLNWQCCTLIGLLAANAIPPDQVAQLGLEFAAVVTFIGMVIPLIKTRPALLSTITAGAASLVFYGLPGRLGLIVAALLGVGVGLAAETWFKTPALSPQPIISEPQPQDEGEGSHE